MPQRTKKENVQRLVRSAAASILLAVCLLAAQTIAFAHSVDLVAHANHHACHVCCAHGSLSAANVAPPTVVASSARTPAEPVAYVPSQRSIRLIRNWSARSPPPSA
jgi:hypothetical protein